MSIAKIYSQYPLKKYLTENNSLKKCTANEDVGLIKDLNPLQVNGSCISEEAVSIIDHQPFAGYVEDVTILKRKYMLTQQDYLIAESLTHSDYTITWEGYDDHGWGLGKRFVDCNKQLRIEHKSTPQNFKEAIWIGGDSIVKPNYAHWMFEHLLKFEILYLTGINLDLPIIVSSRLPDSFLNWANIYLGKKLNFQKIDMTLTMPFFRKLYVTSCPAFRTKLEGVPAIWCDGFTKLRKKMIELSDIYYPALDDSERSDILFLTRQSAKWRKAVNEDSVFEIFRERLGAKKVNISDYNPLQQVKILSNCKLMIVFGGADGFACNFLADDAKVIEILAPGHAAMYTCKIFCAIHGLSYSRIYASKFVGEQKGPHPLDKDFLVEESFLHQLIDSLT